MSKRIVIKLGSQVLCEADGSLHSERLSTLCEQLVKLCDDGSQVLVVSSGAVAAGRGLASEHIRKISDPVARQQVMAATGQVQLMQTYRELFESHGLLVAQVLTSKSDFQTRRHYLNMRGCINALLTAGIIPIINENDVVAVTELMFTDNDELAGLIAGMVGADLLCLLSTVDGVYQSDPGTVAAEPESRARNCISVWDEKRHRMEDIVMRGTSSLGRGGMHSKLTIARRVAKLGTEVVIANGADPQIIKNILAGNAGTRFPVIAEASPAKRWLASADDHATGAVTVNAGAEAALLDKTRLTSLLPVGVEAVEGHFSSGDVILIRNMSGKVLGCGRSRFDHEEATRLLGLRGQKPLVHYDYLYMVD